MFAYRVNGILRLVNDDDIRAYAQRAWHVLTELERDHWARELSEHGPLSPTGLANGDGSQRRPRPPRRPEAGHRPRRACLYRRSPSLTYWPRSRARLTTAYASFGITRSANRRIVRSTSVRGSMLP
jgi:hypothetical protein